MNISFERFTCVLLITVVTITAFRMAVPTGAYASAFDEMKPSITRHAPDHQILIEEITPEKNSTWYWWVLAGLVVVAAAVAVAAGSSSGGGGSGGPIVH